MLGSKKSFSINHPNLHASHAAFRESDPLSPARRQIDTSTWRYRAAIVDSDVNPTSVLQISNSCDSVFNAAVKALESNFTIRSSTSFVSGRYQEATIREDPNGGSRVPHTFSRDPTRVCVIVRGGARLTVPAAAFRKHDCSQKRVNYRFGSDRSDIAQPLL